MSWKESPWTYSKSFLGHEYMLKYGPYIVTIQGRNRDDLYSIFIYQRHPFHLVNRQYNVSSLKTVMNNVGQFMTSKGIL